MGHKVNCILWLYSHFLKNGFINKNEAMNSLNISPMSFARYIRNIRDFLKETESTQKIVYKKRQGLYWLIDDERDP